MTEPGNLTGLSASEVQERIGRGLVNKAADKHTRTFRQIFFESIFSVFNILITAIILFILFFYFKDNDLRLLLDCIGIFLVAFLNTVIAIIQESRSKVALDKVNLLLKRKVLVIRDTACIEAEYHSIVVDDLVVLNRGDQAPVDGIVVDTRHLEMDESLLTGESLPVEKNKGDEILSGSFCVSGSGTMRVTKVGDQSFAAQVTGLAKKTKIPLTPLQRRIDFIIKILFVTAIILSSLTAVSEIFRPRSATEADFVRRLATITISLIPQGLVLLTSVTFALGIFRISSIGAIIQRLNAVESFSNVKLVCMDKTGTLTENKLKVKILTVLNSGLDKPDLEKLLGTFSSLSTEQNATAVSLRIFDSLSGAEVVDEVPFSSALKFSCLSLKISGKERKFVLGAWDILSARLSAAEQKQAQTLFAEKALADFRNLLFAEVTGNSEIKDLKDGKNFSLTGLGIVSLSDTVRTDVYEAVKLFQEKGIKVKVLSGDAPPAVAAVMREIGWNLQSSDMITGPEIGALDDNSLASAAAEKTVFCRLRPEDKLRLIKAFRKAGFYTAMIGDGVNDLPAIKESNLGIAMEEGSSVTKEVSDIVLLKNKFSLLPAIFAEGNKIVNSVNAAAKLFLTKNLLVMLFAVLSLIFSLHFPLTPRRVSLINFFGLGIPSLVLAMFNKNTGKPYDFLQDVFSHIIITALVIIGFSWFGQSLINAAGASAEQTGMAMISIMVFLFITNFIIVAFQSDSRGAVGYLLFGIGLVLIFIFFATFDFDWIVYKWLRTLYEIITLNTNLWPPVFISSGLGSLALVALQILRKIILDKFQKKSIS